MVKLFRHYVHRETIYQIGFDLVLVVLAVNAVFRYLASGPLAAGGGVMAGALVLAAGVMLINIVLGLYMGLHRLQAPQLRRRAVAAWALSLPLAYGVSRLPDLQQAEQDSFGWALLVALGAMLLYRLFGAGRLVRQVRPERVLVLGAGPEAVLAGRMLQDADPNVNLVGFFACPAPRSVHTGDAAVQARPNLFLTGSSLSEVVRKERVGEIVVALPGGRAGHMPMHELLRCKLHGVQVMDIAMHFEKALGQIRRDALSARWLLFAEGFEQGQLRRVVKRSFDLICASWLLLQSSPVMLLAALLIVLEDGGPVFYRQERVGQHGRRFTMVKFRSMVGHAEGDGVARWASKGDPRITRVGHFLRMHRIDELPQLFNVLMGDMSLIGPRPERPVFVERLTRRLPYYDLRHQVKPGITGWAQVRYHYGATEEDAGEKLQYDLYYVKNQCLLLDLVILMETIGVVLACKGAQ